MDFFGVILTRARRDEMLATCRGALEGAISPVAVVTPNPEILLKARADAAYAAALNRATLRIPDGMGLYVAAQMRGLAWPRPLAYVWSGLRLFWARRALYEKYGERLSGSDLTAAMLREADVRGLSVAVAEPLVAEIRTPGDRRKKDNQARMADILRAKYPGIAKLTVYYYDKTNPAAVTDALAVDPHALVICTMGAPAQEYAVLDVAAKCPGVRLALAVGGSLDFECGFVKRAPKVFRKLGVEWAWRLMLEPRKRFRRIWNAVAVFPFLAGKR
jgi:N-acetylglucosaminyldiphosphoundecaprenol N-acetyl-beta-D-mannosaminyltransferase